MRRAGEADVLATTETTYVHVDPKTFTKRAIEPAMRAALEAGAGGKTTDHAGYLARDAISPCASFERAERRIRELQAPSYVGRCAPSRPLPVTAADGRCAARQAAPT